MEEIDKSEVDALINDMGKYVRLLTWQIVYFFLLIPLIVGFYLEDRFFESFLLLAFLYILLFSLSSNISKYIKHKAYFRYLIRKNKE
jgi:hypothetical protein